MLNLEESTQPGGAYEDRSDPESDWPVTTPALCMAIESGASEWKLYFSTGLGQHPREGGYGPIAPLVGLFAVRPWERMMLLELLIR